MPAIALPGAAAVARGLQHRLDLRAVWAWTLTLALVIYLGVDGGGYDIVVRSHTGVIIWWILIVGAVLGLAAASRMGRSRQVALILLGAFAVWSTASTLWSLSTERSLDEASRLAVYLGLLWLAAVSLGDRRVLPHVVGALATGIFVIAGLALLGRLHPGLFSGATAAASTLPGTRSRLSWPLTYWNALGALVAFGVPLCIGIATSARRAWAQAAAAAAVPALVLCGYLTFSRTSAASAGLAVVLFVALSPRRILKVATIAICAGGSAVLVAETVGLHAIENGLSSHVASTQGSRLLVLVIAVCLVVGAIQLGFALSERRTSALTRLAVPRRPAAVATAVAAVLAIVVALALGAPGRIDHAIHTFESPNGAYVHTNTGNRFSALSGNGRYTYWQTTLNAMPGHWLNGFGVGSFQLVWLPRAPFPSYIVNAHSLFVETLVEVGLIGLLLMTGFLIAVIGGAARAIRAADDSARTMAAAATAACCAFVLSAAFDWTWQMPVVPAAFLLLVAAVLAPPAPVAAGEPGTLATRWHERRAGRLVGRAGVVVVGLGCLGLIGTPMAMTEAVRRSQSDVDAGRSAAALSAAQTAINAEPGAGTPELQAALVLELGGRFGQALRFADAAAQNDPYNWLVWLTLSRLAAEDGQSRLGLSAFDRAHRLNPQSLLLR